MKITQNPLLYNSNCSLHCGRSPLWWLGTKLQEERVRGVGYIHRRTYYDGRRANFCKSGNGTTFVFCSAVLPMSQWVTWYNHVCNSPPRLPGLLLYAIVVSPLHCAQVRQKSSKKCVFFPISLKKKSGFWSDFSAHRIQQTITKVRLWILTNILSDQNKF